MRLHCFGSLLVTMMVFAGALGAHAQAPNAQTGTAKPDLSGIWEQAGGGFSRRFTREDPPLQPGALEVYKRNREGVTNPAEQGLDELDPTYNCLPAGFPRLMILRQFQIVQLPNLIIMLFEYDHSVRWIHMDGREHPYGYPDTWMGHSIGKWDGDTLVVDTAAFNKESWLDRAGTPHSDALHVVERIRRTDQDTMEIDFTFEDSKAYTKPWGGKKVYELRPDLEIMEHVNCDGYVQKKEDSR